MPAFIAAIVGMSPLIPTTPVTTVSAFPAVAASISPSLPPTIFVFVSAAFIFSSFALSSFATHTISGSNSRSCASSISIFEYALSAATGILYSRATSSVCVPIEPVEPSTDIPLTFIAMFLLLI